MKKLTPQLILLTVLTLISINANAQTPQQDVNVTIRAAGTPEERVAEEFKLKELRKVAEEKAAADEAARIAATSPKALLRRARIISISSNTEFFEPVQLGNALRKREEFERWEMAIVAGYSWDQRNIADIIVSIDRPLFTYTYTYQITNRSNGIVLSTGKVTAFDGNDAAPKLAARIIEEMKTARGEAKPKK